MTIRRIVEAFWPLFAAIGLLWVSVAALLVISVHQNNGRMVYALDDAYIHMAMAKNFAQHGIWGVTSHGFSSSSSSLLWTSLLALCYFVFGVQDYTLLVLNVVLSCAVLFLAYAIMM